MRRRISWLVAATTSAVVLAFVIPLCLLVRTVAADRALATANEEARAAAILVSGLHTDPQLPGLVEQVDRRSTAQTSVLLPDGRVLGDTAGTMAEDPDVRAALAGDAFTRLEGGTGSILVPVVVEEGTAVVRTTVGKDLVYAGVYRAWVSIVLLGLLLLTAAILIADRLGRRISAPVVDLAQVAERLHQGELDVRATPHGPPETVELADTMNRLAERITELLAAERTAVGDLSHRLRTPVTALRLDAESVEDAVLADRLQHHIRDLQRSIDAIVRDARRPLHSSLSAGCDARAVVSERAAFWSALAEDQGRPVQVELPPGPVPVGLEPTDLTDMLDVLVDNVFAHTPEDAGFSIRLVRAGDVVRLEVADRGPGSAPAHAGAERTGSTGLGLQIVRRTAARVGGHLTLSSGSPGLVATVSLPAAAPAGPPQRMTRPDGT